METVALEQALREHPGDRALWRSYGECLSRHGDPRSLLIHLEQRRACAGPAEQEDMDRQIAALTGHHGPEWDAALPPGVTAVTRRHGFPVKVAVEWSGTAPALIEQALREPFVTALRIEAPHDVAEKDEVEPDFDEDGDPIRPLIECDMSALAALDFGRLVELDLSYFRFGTPGAEALADSATVQRLRKLDLRYCAIGDAGLAALAGSGRFTGVRHLSLQYNGLTAEGMRALAPFTHLTELDLRYNRIGADGVDLLLAAPFAGSLRRLHLYVTDVSEAGARALALAPQLPVALRTLWRSV